MKNRTTATIALLFGALCFCGLIGTSAYSNKSLASFDGELERIEAAAPLMREFASRPFDQGSVIPESSNIHSLDDEGNVIERMEIVYAYKKNGSAESIRRASLWLLNSDGIYPDIQEHLKDRLKEIEAVLPKEVRWCRTLGFAVLCPSTGSGSLTAHAAMALG